MLSSLWLLWQFLHFLQLVLCMANTYFPGNCLFHALSDQLYGVQSRHGEIRSATIVYMREHADFYKQFVDVHPGGGLRRNPKRKNAGAFSSSFNATGPTPEEVTRVFEGHLAEMAWGGTYGDNMEITAFCRAFNVDVKIYQRDFAYMVPVDHARPATRVAHIAYHVSLLTISLLRVQTDQAERLGSITPPFVTWPDPTLGFL